jgi:hypothetical protein
MLFSGAYAVGLVDMPGTVQLPNWFGGDTGGEDSEPRYVVHTSVEVEGLVSGARPVDSSFSYDTEPCGLSCSLSFSDTPQPLALLGADDLTLQISLVNSNGVKVAEVDKFIGEVDVLEFVTVEQSFSNVKAGDYSVEYVLTGTGSAGNEIEQTLTKQIRVPETIQGGN